MPDTTSKRFAHVRFGVRTDVGRKRRNNEDAHGEWPAQGVFCVADGMGGAQDGEVASRAVVESLAGLLPRWAAFDPPMAQEDRLDALARALDAASFWVKSYADSQGKKGCGSTFVGVCLDPADPAKATAVHAGDSRVYRVRGRKIVQITRDHSVAQMAGVKDEKELSPMFRSLILRAVGIKPAVEAERTPFDVAEGDRILICSDGLSRMVPDKEIARIVEAAESPNAAADALVDRANELGGKDNVTVVAVFVGALPAPAGVRARLAEEEMAALFAAPGGGEGDSTTGVTDGGTRSDDTGLTIPKGAGAFDTSSSGEFLPPGGLPPPKAPLDDEDDDEDDEPPPDTDEIPASARMKRRLRGLALAASHTLRTPAGAAVAAALAVVLAGGILVPPMMRAAAERRQAEEAARIEAEKEAEAKRIEEEKAKAEAEKVAEAKRAEEALLVAFDEWIGYANETSNRICKAVEPSELPSAEEIEKLFGDGVDALAASIAPRTRSFIPFRVKESDWSNRCVRLSEARARRIKELKEESAKAAEAAAEDEKKKAEDKERKRKANDLAAAFETWSGNASKLSNRISRATAPSELPAKRNIDDLSAQGRSALSGIGFAHDDPLLVEKKVAWSNRCDRLAAQWTERKEALDKEAPRIASKKAAKEEEKKTARAKEWRKAITEGGVVEAFDEFLQGAEKLSEILRTLGDTNAADRIAGALRGDEIEIGEICAALEDAFVGSVAFRRFATAPGVVAAERQIGFRTSAGGRDAYDAWAVLLGLEAFPNPHTSTDTALWEALRCSVINLNSKDVSAAEDIRRTIATDEWWKGLRSLSNELQKDTDDMSGKPGATNYLSDCLSAWGRSPDDGEMRRIANFSKASLEWWCAAKSRDSEESLDQLALAVAGFEALLSSELKEETGWRNVMDQYNASPSDSETFQDLLSKLQTRLLYKYPAPETGGDR